jgi:phage terminase large subunit-like protein
VFEINQAGLEMIQMAFRQIGRDDIAARVKPYFSSVSKMARAQPYALMHEQGKVHFLRSKKNENLYKELTTYTGVGKSPDEMDALIFSFIGVDPIKKSYTSVHELVL